MILRLRDLEMNLGFGPRLAGISYVSKLLNLFSPQCLYLKNKELGLDNL